MSDGERERKAHACARHLDRISKTAVLTHSTKAVSLSCPHNPQPPHQPRSVADDAGVAVGRRVAHHALLVAVLLGVVGLDHPLEELLPAVAERANRDTMSTIWRPLLRLAPGRLIVKRAAALFGKTYTHGVLTAQNTEEGMLLELSHWPGVERNRLLGIAAGSRAALLLAGNFDATIDFESAPDGAVFRVRF